MNVSYLQTSAKDNIGVSEAFQQVIDEAAQANLIKMAYKGENNIRGEPQVLMVDPVPKKKSCCWLWYSVIWLKIKLIGWSLTDFELFEVGS